MTAIFSPIVVLTQALYLFWECNKTIFCVFIKLFSLQIYSIDEKAEISRIVNLIKPKSAILDSNEKPSGFIYGQYNTNNYIGYIYIQDNGKEAATQSMYLLTKISTWKQIHDEDKNLVSKNAKKLKNYYAKGNMMNLWWRCREITFTTIEPRESQSIVISALTKHYNSNINRTVVAYIYGRPGSGKTKIGMILAQQLGASYTRTFRPFDGGFNLDELHAEINPTAENPLVILLDEFDETIKKQMSGRLKENRYLLRLEGKNGVNTFFDMINDGYYKNMIVIMTSNVAPSNIRLSSNKMLTDLSMFRDGRIDFKIDIDNPTLSF